LLGHLHVDDDVCENLHARLLFTDRKRANVDEGGALLQDERVVHDFDVDLAEQRVQIAASLLVHFLVSFSFEFHSGSGGAQSLIFREFRVQPLGCSFQAR
jgi:hypothetical protein